MNYLAGGFLDLQIGILLVVFEMEYIFWVVGMASHPKGVSGAVTVCTQVPSLIRLRVKLLVVFQRPLGKCWVYCWHRQSYVRGRRASVRAPGTPGILCAVGIHGKRLNSGATGLQIDVGV